MEAGRRAVKFETKIRERIERRLIEKFNVNDVLLFVSQLANKWYLLEMIYYHSSSYYTRIKIWHSLIKKLSATSDIIRSGE